MWHRLKTGAAVGIAATARPHGGLDLSREATACIDIIAAYDYEYSTQGKKKEREAMTMPSSRHARRRSGGIGLTAGECACC